MDRFFLLWGTGLLLLTAFPGRAEAASGRYSPLEFSFTLAVDGNPFDFTQNDVQVTLATPGGQEIALPAFFDGDNTWRVRHSPDAPGRHTVSAITQNGQPVTPQNLQPRNVEAAGEATPGFLRLNPENARRFVFENGSAYYPLGYNLAWRHMGHPPMPELPVSLGRMGQAGINWTRIWMNHWDHKNLDWAHGPDHPQPSIGHLSLSAARQWDEILKAAEANGVYLQMVLQHHGQYSTGADPNWQINPWNQANGGWLQSPIDFFTDEKARQLTKQKYRYLIARYGYSPAVMAWELFNEVQYTDAWKQNQPAVAAWHREMADFIRQHDPYRHLVTTSSAVTEPTLWTAMDYYQAHVYPPDILAAIGTLDELNLDRAYFYGEIGASAFGDDPNAGDTVHRLLWGSLMSNASGAAQYWYWYFVEPRDLLFHYTAARGFLEQSGLIEQSPMRRIDASIDTGQRGPLRFGPGTGWEPSRQTSFHVLPNGRVEGLGGMSAYLQGRSANQAMFPFAEFTMSYPEPGTFAVRVDEMTPAGARLEVTLDDRPAAALTLAAPPSPPGPAGDERPRNLAIDATLELPIPAGQHTLRLENTGADWIHLGEFILTPYTSELAVLAKGNQHLTVLWIYRREPGEGTVSGTLSVPGLASGTYDLVWWDTYTGKPVSQQRLDVPADKPLTVATPPIARDLAAWIAPATRANEQ